MKRLRRALTSGYTACGACVVALMAAGLFTHSIVLALCAVAVLLTMLTHAIFHVAGSASDDYYRDE